MENDYKPERDPSEYEEYEEDKETYWNNEKFEQEFLNGEHLDYLHDNDLMDFYNITESED